MLLKRIVMAHSRIYNLDVEHVDKNKTLRLSNLFLMFQEIAQEHAELLDIGKDKVFNNGRKWIITRYKTKIIRMPKFGEQVTLYTYPGKNNPFFFYRHFYLKDEKGNIIAISSSVWAILDEKTNKIIVNPFGKNLLEESTDFELDIPNKIEEDASNKIKEHKLEYSDIDINGHLNNTRYIELIQNLHNSDFYKDNEIDSIILNYFSEIKEDETVSLYLDKNDKKEIIKGAVNSRDCFKAIITYK